MNPESAAGMMKTLIMFVAVMLALWLLNMATHGKAGWTGRQKIMDITGVVLIAVLLILLIIPLLKII